MPMTTTTISRKVYCVLSARSLPYARFALATLLANALEPLDLALITDTEEDQVAILACLKDLETPTPHRVSVHPQAEIDDLALVALQGLPNLQAFRFGHPCWRKITDPLVMAADGEEMIILDPDLYFPNRFTFEPTPEQGVLLMWQPPSCLLPDETVMRAYGLGVKLAHHVDIGVGHARRNMDLNWLDWFIGELGGKTLPRAMHVEAIVWAALAMREGGGYLHPGHWHCWRNSQWKRLALKAGVPGHQLLRVDPFGSIKCFHGGGAAKWWVPDLVRLGRMPAAVALPNTLGPLPIEELSVDAYLSTQRWKRMARRLGYYKLMGKA